MSPTRATRLRWTAFALAIASALSGCGGVAARYASHLERGKQYLAENNIDKAGVEIRNALQVQPKGFEALYLYGRWSELHGAWREAAAAYQASIESQSDNPQARAGLGKIYVMARSADRAVQTIEPGLRAHPDDADLLVVRAAAEEILKKSPEARADAERAVKLAPANEGAVALLAAIYRQAGEGDHAIQVVKDAIGRSPQSVDLMQVLANLYLTTGHTDLVVGQLRQIVALRPKELSPRLQLAQFLVSIKDADEAQRTLEAAVVALPDNDSAKVALANLIANHRSRAEGEQTLRQFIAQQPDSYDLRFGLAALLHHTGATDEAIAVYREIVARDGLGPKGLIARDSVATLEISRGHPERAAGLIKEVLEKNPRDDDALVLRANLELAHNDPTPAIADLRAALRDQPQSVALHRTLARAYLAKSDTALAEESLQQAEEAAPNDPAVKLDLAQLFLQTGRIDRAVPVLEDLARRSPDDVRIHELLARAYLAQHNESAAIKEYETALGIAPGRLELVTAIASIEEHRGDIDAAIARYETFLKASTGPQQVAANNLAMLLATFKKDRGSLDRARDLTASFSSSENGSLLDTQGWVRFKRAEYAAALPVLERAVARAPDSKIIRFHLAMTELQLGQRDRARSDLEAALSGPGTFTGAEEARVALAGLVRRAG